MITDGEEWHYIALKSEPTDDGFIRPTKSMSRLFRGITSNNHEDFYCLKCLHSFRRDNGLKNMKDCVRIMIIPVQKYLLNLIKFQNIIMVKNH